MITDFIFDGQELSGFGYIICDFDGASGTETHSVSEKSFTNIKSPLSNKSHVVATSEDENLNRKIQIMKSPCDNDLLDITNDDLSELSRWLCREDYKLFKWVEDKDDDEIFYEVQINLRKIELNGGRVGVELDITANAPHGFTREFRFNHSASASASSSSSDSSHITTYECIKDIYTQGSWQDMVVEQTYCMSNDLYSYYEGGFSDMPFSLSDYDYYAIMKNSSIVMVLGFNVTGSMYACANSGDIYTGLLKENRNESYIFSILEQGYDGFINDNGMDKYNYASGVNFCFEGTWDRWDYDVASGTWSQSVNDSSIDSRNEQEYVGASSYSLLDTNCPLYSEYEFAVITCGNESQYSMSELGFDSSRYEYILSMLPSMTQLNQNLPYYDGQKVVGENKDLKINVFTDEEGYIYPDVVIKIKQNGNLELVNKYENRTTYIADCKNGEVITITGGDILQIISSDDTHDMSSCFNYKYPRLCSKYRNYTNKFSTNLACDITIKYKGIRKVGL